MARGHNNDQGGLTKRSSHGALPIIDNVIGLDSVAEVEDVPKKRYHRRLSRRQSLGSFDPCAISIEQRQLCFTILVKHANSHPFGETGTLVGGFVMQPAVVGDRTIIPGLELCGDACPALGTRRSRPTRLIWMGKRGFVMDPRAQLAVSAVSQEPILVAFAVVHGRRCILQTRFWKQLETSRGVHVSLWRCQVLADASEIRAGNGGGTLDRWNAPRTTCDVGH